MTLRVALLQLRSGLSISRNLATVATLARAAARGGATLIATPEMTTVLDRDSRRLRAELRDHGAEATAFFATLAAELGVHLLIGSMATPLHAADAASPLVNRSIVFGPDGTTLATYDKIHLFDVDLPTGESWRESATYAPGSIAALVRLPGAALGLSICYDLRFAALYRQLAQAGAELLAVPAAFTVPTGKAHWLTLLRARAIETGAFVLAPAQGGRHEDGRETYGHSVVIDPWGEVLAVAEGDAPGIVMADLNLAQVADIRARIPSLSLDPQAALRIYGA